MMELFFCPENKDGQFDEAHNYEETVNWEELGLNVADVIVFWVPRKVDTLPGFTTNTEWGAWASTGKVVFGAPEDADKVSYMQHYCKEYNIPASTTLKDTLTSAVEMVSEGAERQAGERYVPLYIWNTDSFQSWYKAQTKIGNRLDHAKLIFNFRPRNKEFVFLWILKVDVWVDFEQRHKSNEFVMSRTDISSVLMYHIPEGVDNVLDYEVVLVQEFRSPASTESATILELPGGSSPKKGEAPGVTASHEVQEETGFEMDPKRFISHGARQLAGTFAAHKAHLFVAELYGHEIEWFKSQAGVPHGNHEDSEITYIHVMPIHKLIYENWIDWSNLGMILSALTF